MDRRRVNLGWESVEVGKSEGEERRTLNTEHRTLKRGDGFELNHRLRR